MGANIIPKTVEPKLKVQVDGTYLRIPSLMTMLVTSNNSYFTFFLFFFLQITVQEKVLKDFKMSIPVN